MPSDLKSKDSTPYRPMSEDAFSRLKYLLKDVIRKEKESLKKRHKKIPVFPEITRDSTAVKALEIAFNQYIPRDASESDWKEAEDTFLFFIEQYDEAEGEFDPLRFAEVELRIGYYAQIIKEELGKRDESIFSKRWYRNTITEVCKKIREAQSRLNLTWPLRYSGLNEFQKILEIKDYRGIPVCGLNGEAGDRWLTEIIDAVHKDYAKNRSRRVSAYEDLDKSLAILDAVLNLQDNEGERIIDLNRKVSDFDDSTLLTYLIKDHKFSAEFVEIIIGRLTEVRKLGGQPALSLIAQDGGKESLLGLAAAKTMTGALGKLLDYRRLDGTPLFDINEVYLNHCRDDQPEVTLLEAAERAYKDETEQFERTGMSIPFEEDLNHYRTLKIIESEGGVPRDDIAYNRLSLHYRHREVVFRSSRDFFCAAKPNPDIKQFIPEEDDYAPSKELIQRFKNLSRLNPDERALAEQELFNEDAHNAHSFELSKTVANSVKNLKKRYPNHHARGRSQSDKTLFSYEKALGKVEADLKEMKEKNLEDLKEMKEKNLEDKKKENSEKQAQKQAEMEAQDAKYAVVLKYFEQAKNNNVAHTYTGLKLPDLLALVWHAANDRNALPEDFLKILPEVKANIEDLTGSEKEEEQEKQKQRDDQINSYLDLRRSSFVDQLYDSATTYEQEGGKHPAEKAEEVVVAEVDPVAAAEVDPPAKAAGAAKAETMQRVHTCFSGVFNRIVSSLNRAHPDVNLVETKSGIINQAYSYAIPFSMEKLREKSFHDQKNILKHWEDESHKNPAALFRKSLVGDFDEKLISLYGVILRPDERSEISETLKDLPKPELHPIVSEEVEVVAFTLTKYTEVLKNAFDALKNVALTIYDDPNESFEAASIRLSEARDAFIKVNKEEAQKLLTEILNFPTGKEGKRHDAIVALKNIATAGCEKTGWESRFIAGDLIRLKTDFEQMDGLAQIMLSVPDDLPLAESPLYVGLKERVNQAYESVAKQNDWSNQYLLLTRYCKSFERTSKPLLIKMLDSLAAESPFLFLSFKVLKKQFVSDTNKAPEQLSPEDFCSILIRFKALIALNDKLNAISSAEKNTCDRRVVQRIKDTLNNEFKAKPAGQPSAEQVSQPSAEQVSQPSAEQVNQLSADEVHKVEAKLSKFFEFTPLYSAIDALNEKAEQLNKNRHSNASQVARTLVEELEKELANYFSSSDEISNEDLKTKLNEKIKEARPILEANRDCNYLIGNLALFVGGLGVLYTLGSLYNKAATGKFLFFSTTRSQRKLDKLESALDQTISSLSA